MQTISNRFPKNNFSTPSPHWLGLVNHFHLTGSPDLSWRPVSLVRAASLNHSAVKYLSFGWINQNFSGDVDKLLKPKGLIFSASNLFQSKHLFVETAIPSDGQFILNLQYWMVEQAMWIGFLVCHVVQKVCPFNMKHTTL